MNKKFLHIALMLTLLSCISCADRDSSKHSSGSRNAIRFDIADISLTTKSDDADIAEKHILYSEGTDTLLISTSVVDNTGFADTPAATKGYITTISNLTSFYTTCFLTDGQTYFKDYVVTQDQDFATERLWLDEPLTFFANSHQEDDLVCSVSNDGALSASFSYVLPTPELKTDPDAATSSDAANQPDYVFAIAEKKTEQDEPVDLYFLHSFSAICFQVGTMPTGTVNRISIKNTVSSGNCSMGTDPPTGLVDFNWTGQKGSETYVQTLGNKDLSNGMLINEDGIIFMMIPHTLADAELEIAFTLYTDTATPVEKVISRKFSEFTTEWEANKRYIYKITMPESVSVEVTDIVEENVKKEVKISNTDISTTYIRAAITGCWVNENGDVIAPWKESDGEFVWGAGWDSHWVKGTDGFYYHKATVNQGDKTHPLFETFTLNAASPMIGAHLELSVITQAVIYYDIDKAWPGNPITATL